MPDFEVDEIFLWPAEDGFSYIRKLKRLSTPIVIYVEKIELLKYDVEIIEHRSLSFGQ